LIRICSTSHAITQRQIERRAHFDHFTQRGKVVAGHKHAAKHQRFNQRGQAHLADPGAMPVPHIDDVERRQRPNRLADRRA
jgi:hypothetical protein